MTRFTRSAAAGLLAFLASLSAATVEARTWTDTKGQKIEAELAGAKGGVVQLKIADGSIRAVPVEQLSADDRKFVLSAMGVKPAVLPGQQPTAPAPPAADEKDQFSEAIRQNPNSPDAHYQRGLARLNRGEAKAAAADFDQAIKLNPAYAEAYDGRGQANSAAGDPVAASKDFDKAIELNPNLAVAYQHRGANLKQLANTPAGKEIVDAKIEDYRKMYQAARERQMTDKAWQPLNSTSGPTSRLAMLNKMVSADYEKAKDLEAKYGGGGSGKGSGGGPGGGSGKGPAPSPGKGPPPESYAKSEPKPKEPPSTPPPSEPAPPAEPESGVIVIPEKVEKGENVMLVADPDKLAAGLPQEVAALSPGTQTPGTQTPGTQTPGTSNAPSKAQSASESKPGEGSTAAKNPPAMPESVDFYRDKDGDGKLDPKKDELLATDGEPKDGYSTEVSTENFPVGKQTYFAAPKMAADQKQAGAAKSGEDKTAKPGEGKSAKPGEDKTDSSKAGSEGSKADAKPGEDGYKAAEPDVLASAAISGSGEVVPPEEAADSGPAPKKPKNAGKARKKRGGGGYVGPRDPDSAKAVERALGYVDRGDYGSAVREYDHLLTEYPEDHYYLQGRAGVHLTNGGYDLAIRDYNRVLEVESPTAEIYYNRGCAHLSVGNLAAAVADFSASLKLDELGKFANLAHNNRGTAYARQGDLNQAIADFDAAIKVSPNDPLAYRNRSLALRKLGKTAEADADLAKSKQLGG